MAYTEKERRLLERYFSTVDEPEHADIYLVRDLPPEVAATLNGVYSRSSLSMRDNFLQRLKKGLESEGRSLEELPLEEAAPRDPLVEALADRSGKFLKTYAIDHGHNSLREGSVVHLAVEKVSQLVTRFIQRERRCSFEESSTRYITFAGEDHWRDPDVFEAGGAPAAAYAAILDETFALYTRTTEALLEHLEGRRPREADEKEGPWRRALRAEAFDAARYLLTPAIQTKWGMVCDARTLSEMITELLSHPLAEFRLVGERLKEQGDQVVGTLLTHARANAFLEHQHEELPRMVADLELPEPSNRREAVAGARLLEHDADLEVRLLASLMYEASDRPLADLTRAVRALGSVERAAMFDRVLDRQGPRDALPFGLEGAAPFEFEMLVDFGAYRDIGRHRKGFQQQQRLTVEHGYLVPPLVDEAGLGDEYRGTLDRVVDRWHDVADRFPHAAGYVTPFAFLQRARVIFDPRQVAYFVELRSTPEGHWAYRKIAFDMHDEVQRVAPGFARMIRVHPERETLAGRMAAEQGAEERRRRRMEAAGDL